MKKFDVFAVSVPCSAGEMPVSNRIVPKFYAYWKDEGYGRWSNSTRSWKDSGGWSNSSRSWKDEGYGRWSNSTRSWKDSGGWSNSTRSWKDSGASWSNSSPGGK